MNTENRQGNRATFSNYLQPLHQISTTISQHPLEIQNKIGRNILQEWEHRIDILQCACTAEVHYNLLFYFIRTISLKI